MFRGLRETKRRVFAGGMKELAFSLLSFAALASAAFAEIKTEIVEYKDGDTTLEGFLAYDDAKSGARPGVVVVHDWTGLQDYAKRRTRMLAELGYVAFAADIYGQGVRPADPAAAGAEAGKYKSNLPLLRRRIALAYDQLKKQKDVDTKMTAAIGYCFGGTTVLELARSGAAIAGVVSFHGNLGTTMPAKDEAVKAKVLVCHGADDPYVKPAEQADFKHEMDTAKVDYEFISYPDAVHSFTKPEAGTDKSKGNAYNEAADKKSWDDMKAFFAKIFKS